ncbi:MAG: hypothetical protein AAF389_20210 [Gemmatimonadota bacterium]
MTSSLRTRGPYLLLAVALLGVGLTSWRPVPAGVWHDDGVYMLVGKAMAGGHGMVYDGVAGSPPAAKFPPAYPSILATFWAALGDIGAVTFAAVTWNLLALAGGGTLFALALRRALGLPVAVALVVAALGFTSTDLLRTALIPLSEPTFLLLVGAAFALWTRLEDGPGRPSIGLWAAICAVLSLAVATRSAGVVLVLAFAIGMAQRRMGRAPIVVTAVPLLVAFLWSRWSTSATAEIPEGARDLLGSYSGWISDQLIASPGAFVTGLPSHAIGVFSRAAAIFVPGASGVWLGLACIVIVPLALHGISILIQRLPPLGWFVLGYFAMLLLWPYLDRRLVAPIHPAVVAACAASLVDLLDRTNHDTIRKTFAAVAAAWVLAFSVVTAYRVADGWPTAPYRLRAERLAASVEALRNTARPDAVVGAPEFWAALHLHGNFTVAPSVRFDPRSVDPDAPMWGTPDEQIELWQASGIDHLVLEQAGQLHSDALDQIEAACPNSVFVLAQMPGSLIVYIDWESVCGAD